MDCQTTPTAERLRSQTQLVRGLNCEFCALLERSFRSKNTKPHMQTTFIRQSVRLSVMKFSNGLFILQKLSSKRELAKIG